ncbi:MAG: HAD family hydrolase [Chloroflexi bacterium]|nr:MAG: HAD family hydrolase [Chloroflexota bacterium]
MIAAIFDLDGTLYEGHIWLALKRHHETHRMKRPALYAYMYSHMALWPLYRWGLLSEAQFYKMWGRHMSWLVGGLTLQQAEQVFRWIVEEDVVPKLRQDVLSVLKEHQQQEHRVVLLSGTFQPLLQLIGQRIGVKDAVGTELAVRNGRYTGGIVPPVCMAEGKVQRLLTFISQCEEEIDLSASYAYADGPIDLPVLELVGHPVAVYPDPRLAIIAEERGWPTIGDIKAR